MSPRIRVTIVSANAETRDGLQSYLAQAEVDASTTHELAMSAPAPDAAVYFPDEYAVDTAVDALASSRKSHPTMIVVIVTRQPQVFLRALAEDGGALVVVPKPAWGWVILDAIRDQLAL